jgi:hypothetical protein
VAVKFSIRSYRRFPVTCPVDYVSGDRVGKGIVRNLSRSGWRVQGDLLVAPGMILTLAVWLPGDTAPVRVETAIVRWVTGHAFGIRIIEMLPVHEAQLRQFLTFLEQQSLGPHGSPRLTPSELSHQHQNPE